MRLAISSLQVLYTSLLVVFISLPLNAQSAFPEGILTYRADTVKRLEAFPAAYIISQLVVYKKADLVRIEVWRVNKFNKADYQKDICIRNKQGAYRFLVSSDSIISAAANFAVFMSYEEEKSYQAERIAKGYARNYEVAKVVKNIRWLNLPAQKVSVKSGLKDELSEMVITNTIDIPVGFVFDSPGPLQSTPLQFTIQENGWMTRLTATDLKSEKISDLLFQVDPKRKIMSLDGVLQGITDMK